MAASALASTANDVFVGMQKGAPLSPPAMAQVLARLGYDEIATPHGLRSSFRDWGAECSHFPREVLEHALAHSVGDASERGPCAIPTGS